MGKIRFSRVGSVFDENYKKMLGFWLNKWNQHLKQGVDYSCYRRIGCGGILVAKCMKDSICGGSFLNGENENEAKTFWVTIRDKTELV